MLDAARRALDLAVRVLLQPSCLGCGEPLGRPLHGAVCDTCWMSVARITPPFCARCGEPLSSSRPGPHGASPSELEGQLCIRCARHPPAFVAARSAGRYDGVLRHLVHLFKYGRHRALSRPLGLRLRAAGADVLADADAVVPVPLHPWRRFQRGFNQADDLARETGLPVWRGLVRVRHGPPQAALPAARRHANVQAAFRVRARRLPYRHLVLIDDVMTTGGTLDECSRELLAAGVKTVSALTVARAANGLPSARLTPRPREPSPH